MDTIDPTLAKALGHNPNAETQNNKESDKNQNNSDKKLDNNENNSYNKDKSTEPAPNQTTGGDADEKFHRILQDTFGGDATKAVKSWVEAQSKYADNSREFKKIKSEYDSFNQLLSSNPALFDIVKRASQGEKIENLLGQAQESTDKPTTPTPASQLDGSTSVDEKKLIESGYLDKTKLAALDGFDRQMAVLTATQRYMLEELPRQTAAKTQEEIKKAQEAEKRRIQTETLNQTNQRRWKEGITSAATSGWDFTGEHEKFLGELEVEVNGIRDTKDLNLISEDAVQIALDRIARRNGIQVKKTSPTQLNLPQGQKNTNQTNLNSKGSQGEVKAEDFHHQLILAQQKANREKPQDYLQKYRNKS